jgi:hypothetical protein
MDARIHTGFPTHPKTKKLARRLGPQGPLSCLYLFLWAAANRSDGDLSGMTAEDVELAIDWTGEEGAFVAGMLAVRFLDGEEGQFKIHDWAEHNPWAAGAQQRSDKARWAALCKQYGRAEAARMMPEYAARFLDAPPEQGSSTDAALPLSATSTPGAGSSTAPSPSPSPSPSPNPSTPDTPLHAVEISERANDAGRACRLMRQAGCHTTNPSHPDLLAALAEGVAPEALGHSVEAGKAREPPPRNLFTWAIGAARGLHADGPAPVNSNHGTTNAPHRESASERVRRLALEGEAADAARASASGLTDGYADALGAPV